MVARAPEEPLAEAARARVEALALALEIARQGPEVREAVRSRRQERVGGEER